MEFSIFLTHPQSWEKLQALQARLRNQLREIEEPFLDELSRIENVALWGNLMRLNDEASLSELASILIEAALISEASFMSEVSLKNSFNEASMGLPE